MEILTINHQAQWVHYTQDHQILRKNPRVIIITTIFLITLDQNQLIIIEMAIVHDDPSHVFALEM